MLKKYNCEKCGKGFNQKSHYTVHQNKKSPCISESKVIETIEKIVDKKVNDIIDKKMILEINSNNKEIKVEPNIEPNMISNTKDKKVKKKKLIIEPIVEPILNQLVIEPIIEPIVEPILNQLVIEPNIEPNMIPNAKDKKVKKKKLIIEPIIEPIVEPNLQNNNVKLTVLDLFCGCGGMSKGLTDAGLDIIAGIDIWNKAINNYKKNYHHKAICADLTKLPPDLFCKTYNVNINSIDIVVGGPPCQSFSIAGRRDKNDPRNSLFMEFVKYLDYFNPKSFIMENVIGILSKKTENNEKVIDIIMEKLTKNYNCIICKLYASDFEVPQNRRRTIIIGIRKDLNIIPKEPSVILEVDKRIPVKTVLQKKDDIDKSYYLSKLAIDGIKNKKLKSIAKGAGFGAQYLDLEKPSFTITARYHKDGHDALVKYSDTEIRRLTILELKRIQSFPDNYILEGSKKDVIMQIGNAVACRFAYHLGKYMIKLLNNN
jgi:DNA (cytosine-5)-methyltransferase 1